MKRLTGIFKREFRLFAANKIMVILYIGGPVLYGFVFHAVYSKGKVSNLPVIVIDKDHTVLSRQLTDMINDADITNVKEVKHDETGLRSIFMANRSYAAVVIPYQFQLDIVQGKQPELITYINNTNLLSSGYVNRSLNLTAGTLNSMLSARYGRATDPFRLNTFKLFNPSSNYAIFIWPSYLAIVLQSVVMVVLALSFSGEFEHNKMAALFMQSGNSTSLLLAGKIIPYCVLACFSLAVYVSYFYLFRQELPGEKISILLIVYLFILTSCCMGAVAGTLFNNQLTCLQFLMVLSMPVYISSGFSWPYEQSGLPARIYAMIFPFMAFINALRILIIEQGRLEDIMNYVQLQAVQLIVYLIIAFVVLRYRLRARSLQTPLNGG